MINKLRVIKSAKNLRRLNELIGKALETKAHDNRSA